MNICSIAGNIGGDPRINYVNTQSGQMAVLNFSVAVKGSKKDTTTGKYISTWFDCALWGKRAEVMQEYLHKGSKVSLSGEVGVDSYQDGQGQFKPKLTLNVREITMQDSAPTGGTGYAPQPSAQQQTPVNNGYAAARNTPQQQPQYAPPPTDFDDDIPF